MKQAVYAGSFDPFTNGHLSIVVEASKLFDRVFICIAKNANKSRFSDVGLMSSAIAKTLTEKGISNCEVVYFDGMIADFCKDHNIDYLVRGLRGTSDYLYEENIAKINYELNPSLRTIYFRAVDETVSSSMIRELLNYDKDIEKYVPKAVLDVLMK